MSEKKQKIEKALHNINKVLRTGDMEKVKTAYGIFQKAVPQIKELGDEDLLVQAKKIKGDFQKVANGGKVSNYNKHKDSKKPVYKDSRIAIWRKENDKGAVFYNIKDDNKPDERVDLYGKYFGHVYTPQDARNAYLEVIGENVAEYVGNLSKEEQKEEQSASLTFSMDGKFGQNTYTIVPTGIHEEKRGEYVNRSLQTSIVQHLYTKENGEFYGYSVDTGTKDDEGKAQRARIFANFKAGKGSIDLEPKDAVALIQKGETLKFGESTIKLDKLEQGEGKLLNASCDVNTPKNQVSTFEMDDDFDLEEDADLSLSDDDLDWAEEPAEESEGLGV